MASSRLRPTVGSSVLRWPLALTDIPLVIHRPRIQHRQLHWLPGHNGQQSSGGAKLHSSVSWSHVAISAAVVAVTAIIASADRSAPKRSNILSQVLGAKALQVKMEGKDRMQEVRKMNIHPADRIEVVLFVFCFFFPENPLRR